MVTYAGEVPDLTTIQNNWAPSYKYAVDATSRTYTGAATGVMMDYTGMLSVPIDVTSTGVLMVIWGFEGFNNTSAASSVRLGIAMTGANSRVGDVNLNAMCSSNGVGNTGAFTSSRMHLYKGLAAGTTTVKTQLQLSSTTGVPTVDNSFLFVSQFYYDGTW